MLVAEGLQWDGGKYKSSESKQHIHPAPQHRDGGISALHHNSDKNENTNMMGGIHVLT